MHDDKALDWGMPSWQHMVRPSSLRQVDFGRELYIEFLPVIQHDATYNVDRKIMLRQCFFHLALFGVQTTQSSQLACATLSRSEYATPASPDCAIGPFPAIPDRKSLESAVVSDNDASLDTGLVCCGPHCWWVSNVIYGPFLSWLNWMPQGEADSFFYS